MRNKISSQAAYKEVNSSAATAATEMSSIGSNTAHDHHDPQAQGHGRQTISSILKKKAQQEYFECLEALSATKVSGSTPPALQEDPPRRSSVSFSPTSSMVYWKPSHHDLRDLKDSIWYTSEDEDRFKADARKEIDAFKMLKRRTSDEDNGDDSKYPQHQRGLCIVGIEQHLVSSDHSRKRARAKKKVTRAVLGAQAHGFAFERIAETVRRYSEWSAAQAKIIGDFQHTLSK